MSSLLNGAQLHLALNHLPIVGLLFSGLVLLGGIISKSEIVKRIGLLLLFLSSILVIPAFFSGEAAEETIEGLAGVSKPLLDEHEEAAEFFLIMGILSAVVSAGALWAQIKKSKLAGGLLWASQVILVLSLFTGIRVGHKGGMISHPEIRPDFQINEAQEIMNDLSEDPEQKEVE